MMASSSVHNELVVVSLYNNDLEQSDQSVDRYGDKRAAHDIINMNDSTHDDLDIDFDAFHSRHAMNQSNKPFEVRGAVRTYSPGMFQSILRQIEGAMMQNPRKYSILTICMMFLILILFIIVLALSIVINSRSPPPQSTSTDDSDLWSTFESSSYLGVVATDHPTCSSIGVNILNLGGNAVDGAIASKLCLGVVSPASSGIGGGGFILIHNAVSKANTFIDARECAPTNSSSHMFESDPLAAQNGGLAIAVPGEIRGLYLAWKDYGSGLLTWSQLVLPSADLADEWMVSYELEAYIKASEKYVYSGDYPELSELYINGKTGKLKTQGDLVQQPKLASFLRNLASNGPDVFYEDMADTLAEEIQQAGGVVTAEDIRSYQPNVYTDSDLVKSSFMGFEYVGVGGSSSGGPSVAGILNFMQSYPESFLSIGDLYYHRLAEAFKHVFAIRMSLGDPDYVNSTEAQQALISEDYMTQLQWITSDDGVLPLGIYGGEFNISRTVKEDHGTTHLSVIDKDGNAVAFTSTINTYFGSKVISPSTGILFNNEMDDFSIPGSSNFFGLAPSPFNYPAPYKRPLSSMSPSFVFDKNGRIRLIGGASGGPRIITATAQVILNYIGKGWDLLKCVKSPRVHSQLLPDTVYIENNTNLYYATILDQSIIVDDYLVEALVTRRHNITATDSVGISQFIAVDPDTSKRYGVSDPRKGGVPAAQ